MLPLTPEQEQELIWNPDGTPRGPKGSWEEKGLKRTCVFFVLACLLFVGAVIFAVWVNLPNLTH